MRIVGGRLRGRALAAPKSAAIRPTADRLREALFNILQHSYGDPADGARVLDLFAGTGALGLEALSRGAAYACFVDDSAKAIVAIMANVSSLGAMGKSRVLALNVEELPKEAPFDLLFADPPYAPGSGTSALRAMLSAGWAAPGAWIAIETERGESVDADGCIVETTRDVGRARLTILRRP